MLGRAGKLQSLPEMLIKSCSLLNVDSCLVWFIGPSLSIAGWVVYPIFSRSFRQRASLPLPLCRDYRVLRRLLKLADSSAHVFLGDFFSYCCIYFKDLGLMFPRSRDDYWFWLATFISDWSRKRILSGLFGVYILPWSSTESLKLFIGDYFLLIIFGFLVTSIEARESSSVWFSWLENDIPVFGMGILGS